MAGVFSRLNDFRDNQNQLTENQGNKRESSSRDFCGSHTNPPTDNGQASKCEILGIVTGKPKYKLYGYLESRISSFENWPKDKTQDIGELAKAGFAYTGVDDSVRCFYCGIGLKDWPDVASPWEQHVLASPNCGHVAQCKGKGFIRRIFTGDSSDSDVDDSNDVVDTVEIAINRNKEAVAAAREFCTDEQLLRSAVKALTKYDLQKKFSAIDLIISIEKMEERPLTFKAEELGLDDEQSDTDVDCATSESDEDIEEDNRQLKERVTCKICFDAFACMIALPCGHMVCCSQCIPALTKCAICRMEIKGTVRAVMAV